MQCAHCLRGDRECTYMDLDIIAASIIPFDHIGCITFTGGEPSLAVPAMEYALSVVKLYNIEVNSFYIVTNGKRVSDEFLKVLDDWYMYCNECLCGDISSKISACDSLKFVSGSEFSCRLLLSGDQYHEDIPLSNILKLSTKSYFSMDRVSDDGHIDVICEGRGENLPDCRSYMPNSDITFYNTEFDQVYVNALGDVLGDCNLSYASQKKYAVANVRNTDWIQSIIDRQGNPSE